MIRLLLGRKRVHACVLPALTLYLAALAGEPGLALTPADFAALPAFTDATVSPDGTRVLMLRSVRSGLAAVVLDTTARKTHLALGTDATKTLIEHCHWISDLRLICMTVMPTERMPGGGRQVGPAREDDDDELRRYVAANFDGTGVLELGHAGDAELISTLPNDEHHVLLGIGSWHSMAQTGLYTRTVLPRHIPKIRPRGDRVQLIDTRNNTAELVQSATIQTFSWYADETGVLGTSAGDWSDRFVLRSHFADTGRDTRPAAVEGVRQTLVQLGVARRFANVPFTAPDNEYPRVAHVGSDGIAWIESRQEGDLKALLALDLRSGKVVSALHRALRADVLAQPVSSPGALPIGARVAGDETKFIPLTDEGVRLLGELDAALPGRTNIPYSLSRDGTKLTVESSMPARGSSWYYYDRSARKLVLLGHEYPQLQAVPVAHVERLTLTARDGRAIPAVLHRGVGATLPAPLVVIPHSNPLERDGDGFDPLVASIANLGISVLEVSYRGVPGHGHAHQVAGRRGWGGKIDEDVADALAQVIDRKLANPDRACVLGVGYAGHLALGAARRSTGNVRCALSIGGFASVLDLVRELGWMDMSEQEREESPFAVGDREHEAGLAHDQHAASFTAPVFLAHGAQDRQLRVHHSERMAAALNAAGKDVTFLTLPNSTSDFGYAPERVQLYEAIAAFLRKHLL